MNYRAQARQLRSEARNHLAELRRERIARRQSLQIEPDEPVVGAELLDASGDADSSSTPISTMVDDAPEASDNVVNFTASRAVQQSMEQGELADVAPAVATEIEPDLRPEPEQEPPTASHEPPLVDETAFTDFPTADDNLSLHPARANGTYDLERLPAIGPGQIWHLQNAGVTSLDDLAHADMDHLVQSLGSMARLMRLREWVSLSRSIAI